MFSGGMRSEPTGGAPAKLPKGCGDTDFAEKSAQAMYNRGDLRGGGKKIDQLVETLNQLVQGAAEEAEKEQDQDKEGVELLKKLKEVLQETKEKGTKGLLGRMAGILQGAKERTGHSPDEQGPPRGRGTHGAEGSLSRRTSRSESTRKQK